MYFFEGMILGECLAEHSGVSLYFFRHYGRAVHITPVWHSPALGCIFGALHMEKKALGGAFSISGIFLLACPTQHKATAFPSGGVLASNQWQKAKQPTLSLTATSWDFYFCFVWFFSSWESASGHISGCQCVRVQRHGSHGAAAWEGGEDPCSGSWHDQVGAEIPGGKCDETVCFGCSCDRGCSEVNGTFHRTGIIFFFQLNVIFPTQECCRASCDCSPCGLNSSSDLCKQVELGCFSWELCNCQQLEMFFPGEDSSTCRSHFPD